ncbi:LON peptidase substrate-binding domain-containing protein [soil metagenome]
MTDISSPELPLFPLQSVLFPGGLLQLKVFEVRYLDLMSACLRERRPFGVVSLLSGGEVGRGQVGRGESAVQFEAIGTLAELLELDSHQPGILQARCRGTSRFKVISSRQQADGLWLAQTEAVADDPTEVPGDALQGAVRGLAMAIESLAEQKTFPFLEPYRYDDASWVANRWCEILPFPESAKQQLMQMPEPMLRLELVDDFLRSKGVVA